MKNFKEKNSNYEIEGANVERKSDGKERSNKNNFTMFLDIPFDKRSFVLLYFAIYINIISSNFFCTFIIQVIIS